MTHVKSKLIHSALAVTMVMISVFIWSCASSPATGDITVTSSVAFGHTHQITILSSDISTPPAQKVITSTANGSGPHTHTGTLIDQDYARISGGQPVTVTSSVTAGHTHDFIISRTAQSTGGGGGGYGGY